MSKRTRQTVPQNLPQVEPVRASFRVRVMGVTGLIVGASLATAVGSTTLTNLILGEEPVVTAAVVEAPATQPVAPATQPITAHAAILDVLPTIPDRPSHRASFEDEQLAALGLESSLIREPNLGTGTGRTTNNISSSSSGTAASASATADHAAVRDAFAAATPQVRRPVTFGGSPDLADAYRSFRTQAVGMTAYDAPTETVVSDTIPALGMDPLPSESTAAVGSKAPAARNPTARPRPRLVEPDQAAMPLNWDTVVNARPNGELAPWRVDEGFVDPFDGDGTSMYDGPYPGDVAVPEPTSLLSLVALAGGVMSRRRRR